MKKKRALLSAILASSIAIGINTGCSTAKKESLEQITAAHYSIPASGIAIIPSQYKGEEVYTIAINPQMFDIEVATATTTTGKKLAEIDEIMAGADAFAAINAGFFTPNGDHDSLIIENGIKLSENKKRYFTYVFAVKEEAGKRSYSIVKKEEFNPTGAIFAIGSIGYIDEHKFVFPCHLTRNTYCPEVNKRSVIGITDEGEVHLIIANDLSVYDFGGYLAANYKDVICMDGGGSVSLEYHKDTVIYSIGWEHKSQCEDRGLNWPCQREVASAIVVKEKEPVTQF